MSDNTDKSNRGKSGQDNLRDLIESLKDKDYIVSYSEDYRDGYKGFDDKQFFFQYIIEFPNNECWILHSTTSIRSDRMNIQQWNAEHLKRLNGYIKKAFVVYPNGLSEKEAKNAQNYQNKLQEARAYSAVDAVVSQSEMYSRVERYALALLGNKGKATATRGTNFEKLIVEILNNKANLLKWKKSDDIEIGYVYDVFLNFVETMELNKDQVVGISATNVVPSLPSGGKPKTDVIVTVDTYEGETKYTFSCKKTSKDWVSAHEYAANQFITTLNITDDQLADAIIEFQDKGSIEKLTSESLSALETRMSAYNDRLNKWVLGGNGGQGDPEIQWANYIVTYNEATSSYSILTVDDYIEAMKTRGNIGNFGTMFKWTYPSGSLGKKIQLKMKVE